MTTRQLAVEVKTVAVKAILLLKMKVVELMVVLQMVNQTKLKAKGLNSKSKFKSILSSCIKYKYVPSVIAEIISFDGGSINDDTDDDLDHQGKISNWNYKLESIRVEFLVILGKWVKKLMHKCWRMKSLRLCSWAGDSWSRRTAWNAAENWRRTSGRRITRRFTP